MDLTVKYYLDEFIKKNKIDSLVLGCTHYPFIKKNIEKFYKNIKTINPSEEVLVSIIDQLKKNNLFSGANTLKKATEPFHEFYASDLSENFTNMLDLIFEEEHLTASFCNLPQIPQ